MLTNNLSTFIIGNKLRLWECLLRNVVTLALLMSLRPSGGILRFPFIMEKAWTQTVATVFPSEGTALLLLKFIC